MKSVQNSAVVCILIAAAVLSYAIGFEIDLKDPLTNTPGLSGSLDFEDFDEVKGPIINDIVAIINKLELPDIYINDGKDGYLKNIKLQVAAKPQSLSFQANEK